MSNCCIRDIYFESLRFLAILLAEIDVCERSEFLINRFTSDTVQFDIKIMSLLKITVTLFFEVIGDIETACV